MKKLFGLAVFLFPVIAFSAPAPVAADYDLAVHVTRSKLVLECSGGLCSYWLHVNGTIAGKNVEIIDSKPRLAVLHTGDYKARVVKMGAGKTKTRVSDVVKASPTSAYEDEITYEMLLPDGSTRQFMLVGEEE